MLRNLFGPKREEVAKYTKNSYYGASKLLLLTDIIRIFLSRRF
jgi:hypothetical protein